MGRHRWFLAVVAVAMLLTAPVIGVGHVTAEGEASLEIHRRVCPPGVFGDLYNVCHRLAQRPGTLITVSGAEWQGGVTPDTGNVVFKDLTPGLYFVSDHSPGGDFTRHHVFCSAAELPGVPRPAGLSAIMLAAGDQVVCDWYITNPDMSGSSGRAQEPGPTPTMLPPLPGGTTLTVSAWNCPENYVNDDYAAACRQHPAEGFRYWAGHVGYLNAIAAGPNGIVQFDLSGLLAATTIVSTLPPAGSRQYYASIVDCHDGENRLEVRPLDTLAGHSMVAVPVSPGDQIHCDWYNISYGRS